MCRIDHVLSDLFTFLQYILEGLFPLLVFFLSFTGKIGCTFVLLGTALRHCLEGEVVESSGFLFDLVQPTGILFAVVEPTLLCLLDMAGLDCLMAGNWGLAEMDDSWNTA